MLTHAETCTFVDGPLDALEHASTLPKIGSKMGIDATKKWTEEGFTREWLTTLKCQKKLLSL